jgi:ribonuclease HI
LATPADASIRAQKEEVEENPIEIFTDGSISERGVGSGLAIYGLGESTKTIQFRLSKKSTNSQAEQFAILSALENLEKIKTKDKRATIYTESKTTLDKLQTSNINTQTHSRGSKT